MRQTVPGLRTRPGIGPITPAQLLATAGDSPDRLASDAAFAALCGACPEDTDRTTRRRAHPGAVVMAGKPAVSPVEEAPYWTCLSTLSAEQQRSLHAYVDLSAYDALRAGMPLVRRPARSAGPAAA